MSLPLTSLGTPRAARSLLYAGPHPPITHFGLTLLRYVVATCSRYAFYQLGLPLPEAAPVTMLRLRLYLRSDVFAETLVSHPDRRHLVAALVEPGGVGGRLRDRRLRSAIAFHRLRQRAWRAGKRGGEVASRGDASREAFWQSASGALRVALPRLQEAFLGELLASLERRELRSRGRELGPAIGPQARRFAAGRARLDHLGPLDPFVGSWAETGVPAVAKRRDRGEIGESFRRRGHFREAYRAALSDFRPHLLALGERLVVDRFLDEPSDLFFVPFDLCEELAGPVPPSWVPAAVATNRAEYEALLSEGEYGDEIDGPPALAPIEDRRSEWDLAPLRPFL